MNATSTGPPSMTDAPDHTNQLQKRLGLPFAVAIMAGAVIGAGILRTPGVVANEAPIFWIAMTLWALGGVYVFLSVNVASELTTALPKAGGIYVPVREAYGDSMGLLAGWAIWAGYAAGTAALALAFADFLGSAVPLAAANKTGFAIAALLVVTLLNLRGVEEGRVSNILGMVIKLSLLTCVVIAAVVVGPVPPQVSSEAAPSLTAPEAAIGWAALITGFQIVLGAYDGWQGPAFFAEEDKDPARNIPRAFFRSAAIIMVVYLGINLCLFTVLDMETLRSSELPVALVIEALIGPAGRTMTGIAAAVMALFTLNAIIMTNPRILFGLARDGLFLKSATKVNRGGTPWVALLVSSVIAIPMIFTGAYVFVFKIQVATGILAAVLYNASYFTLRAKQPDLPRPFRAIGHPLLPALILLVTIALLVGVIVADPESGLWTAGLIAICLPVGFHLGRQRRRAVAQ